MIVNRIEENLFFEKLKEFIKFTYDRESYILKDGKANCMSFVSYIFPEFEELVFNFVYNNEYNTNRTYTKKEEKLHIEEVKEPNDFSICLLTTNYEAKLQDYFEHVGIYYKDKIYHYSANGLQGVNFKTFSKIYKKIVFFDIIKIKEEE